MATIRYRGDAPLAAQVTAYVFGGTWEATDVVLLTFGAISVSVVAGSTTISTVVDNVVSAWNALTEALYPQFAEITASRSSNSLVLTADNAGRAFKCTVSTTETGGGAADAQTIDGATSSTGTNSTANSGPSDLATTANYSGGALPVNGDTLIFEELDNVDVLYNLDALSAVTLAALHIRKSFTGAIGLPALNADHDTSYYEYRTQELTVGATIANLGHGDGDGSGRIKINFGTVQTACTVLDSGDPADANGYAVELRGTHASNDFNILKGRVGIAVRAGQTAVCAPLRLGYQTNVEGDAIVFCGLGVTLTAVDQEGGQLEIEGADGGTASASIVQSAGTCEVFDGSVTAYVGHGGTFYYRGDDTVADLHVGSGCVADFSRDQRPRTVSECELYAGGTIREPGQSVTWSDGINLHGCGLADVTLDLGENFKLTPAAVS